MLICYRFHDRRANSCKQLLFRGYPRFTFLFESNPLTQRHKILSQKIRILGAAHSNDFVILACTVLIGLQSVTDTQTVGQTDGPA